MTLRNIDDVSAGVAGGLKQLRKFGFRLVREAPGMQDDAGVHHDALLAACTLLGLDASAENLRLVPVFTLASTITRIAVFKDSAG